MTNFIIKTHRKDTLYNKPHLFILNKGMNSGKPQYEPFTNSFVIIFSEEKDRENIFLVAYSLWKTKFWFPHLCGSVIPFLHLTDFKKHFNPPIQFNDSGARATFKKCGGTQASGKKRKAAQRGHPAHK
jgi:hypothetical protein